MSTSPDKTGPAMEPAIRRNATCLIDPLACGATSDSGSRLPVCRAGIEPASELCEDPAHRFLLALAKAVG